jgi:hypothetical protein
MKDKRHIKSFNEATENLNISGVSDSSFNFNDEKLRTMMKDLVDYTRGKIREVPKDTESKKFVDNFIKEYEDWYKLSDEEQRSAI